MINKLAYLKISIRSVSLNDAIGPPIIHPDHMPKVAAAYRKTSTHQTSHHAFSYRTEYSGSYRDASYAVVYPSRLRADNVSYIPMASPTFLIGKHILVLTNYRSE